MRLKNSSAQFVREDEITYVKLAKRLKKTRLEASITNKLKRGTFPPTWFPAVPTALELDGRALDEV